jgi:hypothetical protein
MLTIRTASVTHVVKKQKRNITPFVKNLYFAYFQSKLGDHDKKWAPHVVCKTCAENLSGLKGSIHLCRLAHRWLGVSHTIIAITDIFVCVKYLGITHTQKGGHSVSKSVIGNTTCAPWTRHSNSYTAIITE